MIKRMIIYVKRPKCKNKHKCWTCEHMGIIKEFDGGMRGIRGCKINAR